MTPMFWPTRPRLSIGALDAAERECGYPFLEILLLQSRAFTNVTKNGSVAR